MSKKRPLNFQAPSFAEDSPPPPGAEDGFALGLPPVPADAAPPATQAKPRAVAARSAPQQARRPTSASAAAAKEKGGGFIYFLAVVATLLWAGGLTAYTLGFRGRVGPFEDEHFAVLVLALLGLAPVGLIWVGAYALRQGMKLLAEAALAARAADLAAAAGEASEAARMAGDDLARQAIRLEAASVTVGEQVQVVEEGLGQQRAALVALSHTMRADQEDLAASSRIA